VDTIATVSGIAELKMDPAIRKMAREMEKLVSKVTPLEIEASKICKEVSTTYDKLVGALSRLSEVTGNIHLAYSKMASKFDFDHFTLIGDLYEELSSTFYKWRDSMEYDSQNFFENIRTMFNFSYLEESGIQNVFNNGVITLSWLISGMVFQRNTKLKQWSS